MISQQAKDGFDHTVMGALKAALRTTPEASCEVEVMPDGSHFTEEKMVVLTVSSYLFRVMILIYFTLNKPTRQHFATIHHASADTMSESDFMDVIGECGNVCCGAISRELAHHYPHLGMSTPNILDRHCVDFLTDLDASHIRHFKVSVDGALSMHASLCVCDYADIDFTVDMSQAEESNGELEMF
jgi:hypothetical protein